MNIFEFISTGLMLGDVVGNAVGTLAGGDGKELKGTAIGTLIGGALGTTVGIGVVAKEKADRAETINR